MREGGAGGGVGGEGFMHVCARRLLRGRIHAGDTALPANLAGNRFAHMAGNRLYCDRF